MWSAGDRIPTDAILCEDPGSEERLHQSQDAFVPDSSSHPTQKGRVRDLIEAGRDVSLENPLIVARRRSEEMNLGNRVMSASLSQSQPSQHAARFEALRVEP